MPKLVQLKDFIDDNHRLISILGVFSGLTAFFVKIDAIYLSFISFLILFVLMWELRKYFPGKNASDTLQIFELFIYILIISLIVYFFIEYKIIIMEVSILAFLFAYFVIATKIYQKYKLSKLEKKISLKRFGNLFLILVYMFGLISIVAVASYSAYLLRNLLQLIG